MNLLQLSKDYRVHTAGPTEKQASTALVMLHGRGASAQHILELGLSIAPADMAILAPQAPEFTWYPQSFLAPIDQNEPYLSSGLNIVASIVDRLVQNGIDPVRIALGGFSQGACMALEFAARRGNALGAVLGLSGGLIGPPGMDFGVHGSMENTAVFLGCSDRDPHIPLSRVQESAAVFKAMGANVDLRLYPNLGHTISADALAASRTILTKLSGDA